MADITIILDNSLYAHSFNEANQIHQECFQTAFNRIKSQVDNINNDQVKDSIYLDHIYRTISIFGERGSGKTSFLISLLEKCMTLDVKVLPVIDPTLVEHKKPMILSIISMINQLVEDKLRSEELQSNCDSFCTRKEWREVMSDISTGVFAIDEVGQDYNNTIWQDEDYVLYEGLKKVHKANNFEQNLRRMFTKALSILDKKAFIIAFDDIDVDASQGWQVLETLRRYLPDEHIISIVTGDLKLYNMLVKNELTKNLTISNDSVKENMANELLNQYMIKLLSPANRFNLLPIYNLLQLDKNKIYVQHNSQEDTPNKQLQKLYALILEKFNIKDTSSQKMYIDFFTNMSLRSQIHFLRQNLGALNNQGNEDDNKLEGLSLEVFYSRLLAAGIDLNVLHLNDSIANISILNYLNSKRYLKDNYLLLPALSDKDSNSNLTAFSLVICKHFSRHPYAIFDYMLRIGYLRNVVQPIEETTIVTSLCKYAGWNQLLSLKNNVGLTMAYIEGKKLGNMKEYIPLFRVEKLAKKKVENALDAVLKTENNPFVKLLATFPFIRTVPSYKNEGRCYYSIFALLAVIGELLKCKDENEMQEQLNDLKLFRSYQIPQDESGTVDESEINQTDYGVEVNSEGVDELAKSMSDWKKNYPKDKFLPPYAIGRIMTRLYSSLSNIENNNVGQMMNLSVANFFNACLIEEAKFKVNEFEKENKNQSETESEKSKEENSKTINNNNLRTDTNILCTNLKNNGAELKFTQWMMSCPMLNCFVDDKLYNSIMSQYSLNTERISVFMKLSEIDSKYDNNLPPFSGQKGRGIQNTLKILHDHGILDSEIENKIINETNVQLVKEYIESTKLFNNVLYLSSVKSFRKNYNSLHQTQVEHNIPTNE